MDNNSFFIGIYIFVDSWILVCDKGEKKRFVNKKIIFRGVKFLGVIEVRSFYSGDFRKNE